MNKLPKNQQRAIIILSLLVLIVFLVLLAIMSIPVFFAALVAAVLGICLLRLKKPDFFSSLSREKKPGPGTTPVPGPPEKRRDTFSAHIILLYQGGMTNQQITVDREEFSIGRSPNCNFVLSGNTDISRTHAIIRYVADRECSTITDNHSSHGTRVNGEYLTPGQPRILHNGDLIQIEDRVMTVQNKNY